MNTTCLKTLARAVVPALLALFASASTALAANATVTLNKDVMAKAKFPDANFGADVNLQTSAQTGFQKIIYLQFSVSGIPVGATGISAQLKLRSQTTTGTTPHAVAAHSLANTSWLENTLTWNNKPSPLGATLDTIGDHTSGQDSVWNVTSAITGNGTFALALDSTYPGDTTFSSREGANAPVLVVTYTPSVTYNIYRGNTHAHSSYSHDSAPTNTDPGGLYAIAVNEGYDYFCVTDHSQSDAFLPVSASNAAWVDSKNDATAATTSSFVAIGGYEHSENNGGTNPGKGHLTVLNTNTYLNADDAVVDVPYLYNWLKTVAPARAGTPVVAGFNHPGTTQYNSFDYRDAQVTDIIALCELVNSDDNVYEDGWRAALAAGWKVAPTSGGDTHASCCGIANDTSRAFVLATAKTPAAILDAMHNRRTYAALHDDNIQITYKCNGAMLGSTLASPSTFNFEITVNDDAAFATVEIVGSGSINAIASTTVNGTSKTWTTTLNDTTSKYFYVRVTRAGTRMAWTAPVWTGR